MALLHSVYTKLRKSLQTIVEQDPGRAVKEYQELSSPNIVQGLFLTSVLGKPTEVHKMLPKTGRARQSK